LETDTFTQLMDTILQRKAHPSDESYTNKLLTGGCEKIGRKILEEAAEVVDAGKKFQTEPGTPLTDQERKDGKVAGKVEGTKDHIIYEAGDLIYHLWVLLAHFDIPLDQVRGELARRFGQSGLSEKASRK